ncbi:DUF1559 domain-containing protein [Blastopirellula sp. J2-11]|uniref:DUF1559 domain-containing protein n=1 Tax=Blastopirellula sp. J2-11 TaxID=2943192 RepID=UPI0021C72F3E|nr:DUF1559 domain-containing protein [Blastopirellula sp. J2-11]
MPTSCLPRIRRQVGFTLVELLVVIAIIGVLIALLLPAVQQAREAARRMDCSNRLKQFGIAYHNYHDTHGNFPSGYIVNGQVGPCIDQANPSGTRAPWSVLILPFLEQQNLHDQFRFNEQFSINNQHQGTATNHALQWSTNTAFHCPSDPLAVDMHPSYLACAGGGPAPSGSVPTIDQGCKATATTSFVLYYNGVFSVNSKTKFSNMLDGTSNSYLMGESFYVVHPSVDAFSLQKHSSWAGGAFYRADYRHYTNLAAAVEPINQPVSGISTKGPNKSEAVVGRTFGSFHPGGCNMLLGDASVHYMSQTMDINTHRALGAIADGGPVGGLP